MWAPHVNAVDKSHSADDLFVSGRNDIRVRYEIELMCVRYAEFKDTGSINATFS